MDRESDNLSSIVVLEVAAGFPQWVAECQRRAPNSIVIAQVADDSAKGFVSRTIARVEEFTRGSCTLKVAIVVCNSELQNEQLAARYRICRKLLEELDRDAPSELILATSGGAEDSKHAILSLAGDLCEAVGSPNVSVRVRFGDRASSGTMSSVIPAPQPSRDAISERR